MTRFPCSVRKPGQVLGTFKVLFSLCLDGQKDKFSLLVQAVFCLDNSRLFLSSYTEAGVLLVTLYNSHHDFFIQVMTRQSRVLFTD